MQAPQPTALGKVYLIGPVTGDPHWLSGPAKQCLAEAHLVLYDRTAPPPRTDILRPSVELVPLQPPSIQPEYLAWFQQEVIARLLVATKSGRTAVYLRAAGSEAAVAGGNETEMLHAAGVPVEVVLESAESACSTNLPQESRRCTAGSLLGKHVLVTRPVAQSADLLSRLRSLGAEATVQPAIEIAPPPAWEPVDRALVRLDCFDWLVFSSVNGVDFLLERLKTLDMRPQLFPNLRFAAIGPSTAERLRQWGLEVTVVPPQYRAESLADLLAEHGAGKRFLLARASRGREVLAERLRASGATVEQIVVYTSRDVRYPEPMVVAMLRAGKCDWVTVTSSAIARSLHAMLGADLDRARLASISPITSATLRELGHEPAVEADPYTTEGLVRAMLEERRPEA